MVQARFWQVRLDAGRQVSGQVNPAADSFLLHFAFCHTCGMVTEGDTASMPASAGAPANAQALVHQVDEMVEWVVCWLVSKRRNPQIDLSSKRKHITLLPASDISSGVGQAGEDVYLAGGG